MIQPPHKLKHPPARALPDRLPPHIHHPPPMAREHELVLEPLAAACRSLVERTRMYKVLGRRRRRRRGRFVLGGGAADVLVEDELAVEGIQQNVLPRAEHHVAGRVVDPGALDGPREGQLADELEAVEVPEEGDAVLRDGEDRAEGLGHGDVSDGGLVSEEGGPQVQLDERLARRGLHCVDRHDAVFACCDERFGVGEGERRDLADVQVLEETGGLGLVS